MTFDIEDDAVTAWVGQFEANDQALARSLLEQICYVDAEKFRNQLVILLQSLPDGYGEPIGLYAERPIRKWKGKANRLFKESRGSVKRAFGGGPQPVLSSRAWRHETGSEGIVANIITQVQRANQAEFVDHPGPETIRKRKVRRFVLVTDFVGTGLQASNYLDAAWRIASAKSWASGKFIQFEVACYASTAFGKAVLEAHPCAPRVREVISCPTLEVFEPYSISPIVELCRKYGPKDSEAAIPHLGFGEIGALIAFAHGMPNNAPRLLFKRGKNWEPLFPSRTTSAAKIERHQDIRESLAKRLQKLREVSLANLARSSGMDPKADLSILVLAALKRKPRTIEAVSARTGLDMAEAERILKRARHAGWISDDNRLTSKAYSELHYLRRSSAEKVSRYTSREGYYFPQSLRAPTEGFS